ncbi:MAG TPA: hydrogenase maturation protease [Myxococcota bacterium]|nr:hydrogenase maturation protease [Myxococcota bacterium]
MRVTVIGVGTRHGGDAAGLAVVTALEARALPRSVALVRCERPLPDLLEALAGADAAIVVDAARSDHAARGARRVAPAELADVATTSSHGFGVARALALAEALGRAPARVELVAIEGEGDADVEAAARIVVELLASLTAAEG